MKKIIGIAAPARSGKDTVAALLLQHDHVAAYALADPLKIGCQALFGLTDDETWHDDYKERPLPLWQHSPRQFFQQVGTDWLRGHNPEHWLLRAQRALSATEATPTATAEQLATPQAVFKLAAQAIFGLSAEQTWDDHLQQAIDSYWQLSPQQMVELLQQLSLKSFPDFAQRRQQRPLLPPSRALTNFNQAQIMVIKDIRFENEAAFLRQHHGQIWHIVRNNAQKVNPHASELGIAIAKDDVVIDNNGSIAQLAAAVAEQWQLLQAG